jgi:hypothetical protein
MIDTDSKAGNNPYSACTRDELGHTRMSPSTVPSSRVQKSRTVTRWPLRLRPTAALTPEMPEPMITMLKEDLGFAFLFLDYLMCVLHVREKFRSGGHSFYTRSEAGLLYSLFA